MSRPATRGAQAVPRPRRVDAPGPDAGGLIDDVLRVLRRHLGMEVAFVGRIAGGRRHVERVDADAGFVPLTVGDHAPLRDTLCGPVVSGALPAVVHDARRHPVAARVPATAALPIGAHLSVPVPAADGRSLGTLCCFSRTPDPTLGERDADLMRAFAEVVGAHLEPLAAQDAARQELEHHIGSVLDAGGPAIVLQPIVALHSRAVTGYEALARFPHRSGWTVEDWFSAAESVGMAGALEAATAHAALKLLDRIPAPLTLAVNVSVTSLTANPSIVRLLSRREPDRIVLELTEHHQIQDIEVLQDALKAVRTAGVAVALDDTGTGYSGLERLLALRPEILKLDRCLVQGVHAHPGRQAMCEAMVGFTRRMGAQLIAEGIEDPADLDTLTTLGVSHGQGYLLGRPAPPDQLSTDQTDPIGGRVPPRRA